MNGTHRSGLSRLAPFAVLLLAGCAADQAGATLKSATIGPTGGTIAITAADSATLSGTSLTIPAGALAHAVTITISSSSQAVTQSGDLAAGPIVSFAPDGTQFAVPVTITIPVAIPSGESSADLVIEAVEGNGSAQALPVKSQASGFATFQTGSFTRFGGVIALLDGGIACNCPDEPAGDCTTSGPGPCHCPVACDGGSGTCSTNVDCPTGSYCALTNCAGSGTCTVEPEVCPLYCSAPELCGCDGRLYCNACMANGAGTSVSPDAGACGGQDGGLAP